MKREALLDVGLSSTERQLVILTGRTHYRHTDELLNFFQCTAGKWGVVNSCKNAGMQVIWRNYRTNSGKPGCGLISSSVADPLIEKLTDSRLAGTFHLVSFSLQF
ncbi:hypothetical protein BaRGS_00026728 [Batillaria attramentaria]|uniref:Uncharacterized protein n=1 Tax=Batillaria attramentaria TaxID=370345 RepID=A0ABD0K541_9CAEN